MNTFKKLAVATAFAASAISPAFAQADILLELPGVEGGSQLPGYAGQIEVLAMSVGISAVDKKPCIAQDAFLTKFVDKATADMIVATALGTLYPTAKITFVGSTGGGALAPILQYTFTNARFSSYNGGASSNSGILPTENFSIRYGTLTGTVFTRNLNGTVTQEAFAATCN